MHKMEKLPAFDIGSGLRVLRHDWVIGILLSVQDPYAGGHGRITD